MMWRLRTVRHQDSRQDIKSFLTSVTGRSPIFLTTSASETGLSRAKLKEKPVATLGGMSSFNTESRLTQVFSYPNL
jgi:hypothetical protein